MEASIACSTASSCSARTRPGRRLCARGLRIASLLIIFYREALSIPRSTASSGIPLRARSRSEPNLMSKHEQDPRRWLEPLFDLRKVVEVIHG